MKESLKARIIAWNLKRNGLAFDPLLEIKLLSEEANEFYTAETVADRLREAADFIFVATGTVAKFQATKFKTVLEWQQAWAEYQKLYKWIDSIYEEIMDSLEDEGVDDLLFEAVAVVTKANEAKTAEKNTDGKVVKGSAYVDPMPTIRGLIEALEEKNGPTYH